MIEFIAFSPITVSSNSRTITDEINVQCIFKLKQLIIPSDFARFFRIYQIIVGKKNILKLYPIYAEIFIEDNYFNLSEDNYFNLSEENIFWKACPLLSVDTSICLDIKNTGPTDIDFYSCLSGSRKNNY